MSNAKRDELAEAFASENLEQDPGKPIVFLYSEIRSIIKASHSAGYDARDPEVAELIQKLNQASLTQKFTDDELAKLKQALAIAEKTLEMYSRHMIEDGELQIGVQWINDRELSGYSDDDGKYAKKALAEIAAIREVRG